MVCLSGFLDLGFDGVVVCVFWFGVWFSLVRVLTALTGLVLVVC